MQVVRLVDEVDVVGQLKGKEYEDTLFIGPAMIALMAGVSMTDCAFDAPNDALFVEVPEGSTIVGVIGVTESSFTRCRFQNVGMLGTREAIAHMKEGFTEAGITAGQPEAVRSDEGVSAVGASKSSGRATAAPSEARRRLEQGPRRRARASG